MKSRNLLDQSTTSPGLPKQNHRPNYRRFKKKARSDVATMLREAYKERQQSLALQTQLLIRPYELRDVQAENKRLKSENQSQLRSISQLKTDSELEAKREQDSSLTQINN